MKKFILILAIIGYATISMAQDRTARIVTGQTQLQRAMVFTAADSIVTSDSLVIEVTNPQKYLQHQTAVLVLEDVDGGSPSILVTLRGKYTSSGDWYPIGTPVTWTGDASNPVTITSTAPLNYNYLKLSMVASGAAQHAQVTSFDLKTANAFEVPINAGTLTLTRASAGTVTLTSKDNDANAALTIAAGGTGALTLGDAGSTTAITSSDWAISATGAMTGIGAITADGNASIGGTLAVTGTTALTGATTATGAVTLNGGLVIPTPSPVIWAKGGSTVLATSGTDAACANGTRFWVEIDIPYNVTLTGLAYLVGSVGGTDSVVVQLVNSAGTQVATSRAVGTAAAIVGTAAQFQSVAFTAPYAAVAGKYYAVVQFNGTTAKFRAYPIPGSKFITGSVAGTWQTAAGITPGTTFTADVGPIVMTY